MPESGIAGNRFVGPAALVGFGRFWWDFLIGDTPELFVGVVVVLVAVGLLTTSHSRNTAAVILLPRPSSSCSRDLAARRSALRSSGRSCQPRAHAAPAAAPAPPAGGVRVRPEVAGPLVLAVLDRCRFP